MYKVLKRIWVRSKISRFHAARTSWSLDQDWIARSKAWYFRVTKNINSLLSASSDLDWTATHVLTAWVCDCSKFKSFSKLFVKFMTKYRNRELKIVIYVILGNGRIRLVLCGNVMVCQTKGSSFYGSIYPSFTNICSCSRFLNTKGGNILGKVDFFFHSSMIFTPFLSFIALNESLTAIKQYCRICLGYCWHVYSFMGKKYWARAMCHEGYTRKSRCRMSMMIPPITTWMNNWCTILCNMSVNSSFNFYISTKKKPAVQKLFHKRMWNGITVRYFEYFHFKSIMDSPR